MMMKKKMLVVSAAVALLLIGQVQAHREIVDEEEQAQKLVNDAVNKPTQEEPFIENLRIGPIGSEVYTGPKDFAYCNIIQKI